MLKEPRTKASAVWKQRFRASGIWWAEVARRAPARGLAVTTTSGTGQLYAWDVPSGALRQLTHRPEGVFSGYLSPDGSHAYYLHDEGGSETGHYVRVPWDGGPEQDVTPNMEPYAALYRCAVSENGTMFAFTPTEANGFPLYCLDLGADGTVGAPRELYRSPKLVDDAALSYNAEMAVVATTEHSSARQYSLLAVATADGRRVGELLDWSVDGRRILLRQVYRAVPQLCTYDLQAAALTRLQHPGGTYEGARFGPRGQIFALWADATHLPQVVALDGATGTPQGTVLAAGEAPSARPFTSVSFRSSDGTEIQGWLGLPEGGGPFPTILAVHGGPHYATLEFYDPEGQAWLDHGYAYLTINYRGSTTFGREFKEKIWGDLGHWEIEDMVAARDWLVREGIARPDAILVTGASYGGYLTLMALGKRPDLWAGGMALVAPADFTTEFYDGTDWSRGYLAAMMGGTPEEKPEQYAAS